MTHYSIHPALASAPAVIIALLLLLELVVFIRKYGDCAYLREVLAGLFFIVVIAAFLSGYHANEFANQTFLVPDEVIAIHHRWGKALLFGSFGLALVATLSKRATHSKQLFTTIYWILLFGACACTWWTSFLGGSLVFAHGAGVYAIPTPH